MNRCFGPKAVADRIYKELGTPYIEADIIEAQSWLKEVRKYGEIAYTPINKKLDSTPPVQPPLQPPVTPPATPPLQPPADGGVRVGTVPAVVPGNVAAGVAAVVSAPSEVPELFKNARALSDKEAISSLKSEHGVEFRQ